MLNTLRGLNIKFNPKPWDNTDEFVQTVPAPVVQPVTVQDNTFVDLHIEVASKVDALLEKMESEGKFDNWDTTDTNELTPEKTMSEVEQTVLRT